MVVGPNGTGKSTIVCAIALGLGGKPEVLGRAGDLREFIKHGEESASIEIEIKETESNLVIKRSFGLEKKGASQWMLNDKIATETAVKNAISAHNIQVDNLCQFLPQDRVSGFARMDSVKLFRETERAAGKRLLETHNELIDAQDDERKFTSKMETLKEEIKVLEDKNALLERDVQRIREIEDVKKEIEKLKAQLLVAKYNVDVEKYTAHKTIVEATKKKYEALSNVSNPLTEKKNEIKRRILQLEADADNFKKKYDKSNQATKEKTDQFEKLSEECNNMSRDIKRLENKKAERNLKIEKLVESKEDLRLKYEHCLRIAINAGVCNENGERLENSAVMIELEKESRAVQEEEKEIRYRLMEKERQLSNLKANGENLQRDRHNIEQKISSFNNIKEQRFRTLEKLDRHTAEAVRWLRANRNLFNGDVYEPICLELNIRDTRYASHVESLLSRQDFTLNEMGFETTVFDLLEGPDAVLAHLCGSSNIHNKPIMLLGPDDRSFEKIEKYFGTGAYAAGDSSYAVRKAYGQSSTRIENIRPAVYLNNAVDEEYKLRLENDLKRIFQELKDTDENCKNLLVQRSRLEQQQSKFQAQRKEINLKKAELHRSFTEVKSAYTLFSNADQQVRKLAETPSEDDAIEKLLRKIADYENRKSQSIKDLCKVQSDSTDMFLKRSVAIVKSIGASLELNSLDQELTESRQQLKEAKLDLENAQRYLKELKELAKASHTSMNACKKTASDEILTAMEQVDQSIDELKSSIAQQQAKVELAVDLDPKILIAQKKKQILDLEIEANDLGSKIKQKKDDWILELNQVIETISTAFSDAFASMGCAGLVRLNTEGPISKWGIEICVKFRDEEKLQRLDASRQSGGERSVSTMLYLISLQSLSKSPFRVVDEINQGMDPRNERLVHKQIVHAACEVSKSQYFLITPKLLPDLAYHEKLTLLCVLNGVWQPERWTIAIKDKLNSNKRH